MKQLIVFDLDGTLAESKAALDAGMAALLNDLLDNFKVAVISGGDWPQFETQLLAHLAHGRRLANLALLPTCGPSSSATREIGSGSIPRILPRRRKAKSSAR